MTINRHQDQPAPAGLLCPDDQSLDFALKHEWLETNGLGGYACGTIADAHTRKYHGLLTCQTHSPPGPHLLLSKLETTAKIKGERYELSTNLYPNAVHPHGHQLIESFSAEPYPSTVYRLGDAVLRRSILMPLHQEAVLVRYELLSSPSPLTLHLSPLLAFRSAHTLTTENMAFRSRVFPHTKRFTISPYDGMPDLHFETDTKASFFPGPHWNKHFLYPREAERGYNHIEDLFCPGMFEEELALGQAFVMRIGTQTADSKPSMAWDHEIKRRLKASQEERTDSEPLHRLKQRGEQFIVREGKGGRSIVAGYPWFGCWGRDAMIAAPGLCFRSNRVEDGIHVLKTFAKHQRDGLIPNFISPDGHHAYNSADASVWFAWAVGELIEATGDVPMVASHFLKPLELILESMASGQANGVRLSDSGLIHNDAQMTWMDANANGHPVTPRQGLAVEMNALWIHAMGILLQLGDGQPTQWIEKWTENRSRATEAFGPTFWLDKEGYLADVVDEHGPDRSLRPNQVLAVSLPIHALKADQEIRLMSHVQRDLSTPYGLRTLSPNDLNFQARYEGDQTHRDQAYHQGTVWPWLIGHYVQARLKLASDPVFVAAELVQLYRNLLHEHIDEYGIGSIAEIFDGSRPHRPAGCIAQAWSVGEIIRGFELIHQAQSQNTDKDGDTAQSEA